MGITATDVKTLRDKTGAGMLDCKKALEQAGGDFSKAEKLLKEQGLAAASKRSERATNEGRIFSKLADKKAALLELSCETDFVARNQDFIALGDTILGKIIEKNLAQTNEELENLVKEAIGRIKENLTIRRFSTLEKSEKDYLCDYIHGEGKIGVLVKASSENPKDFENQKIREFLFDCALHIAAYNPGFITKKSVPAEYLKEQEEVFAKQVENLGKPANVLAGIVQGKLNKHLAEICFMQQPFVKDDKRSVEKVLEDLNKENSTKVSINTYLYYRVGESL